MVRASSTTAAALATTVRVEVIIGAPESQDTTAEWEVIDPAPAILLPAIRDRLS